MGVVNVKLLMLSFGFVICCLHAFHLVVSSNLNSSTTNVVTFEFTQSTYVATILENTRRKVYVQPTSKMGIYLSPDLKGHVRYRIISGDAEGFFKAESVVVGNFAYLRIHTKSLLDLSLNRESNAEFELVVRASVREIKRETAARVLVKVTDENDLAPIFQPDHYSAVVNELLEPFSVVVKVHATDADEGLNGEVYYNLKEASSFFAVHHVTGVLSSVRPLRSLAGRSVLLTVVAEDRAARLFADQGPASRPNVAIVNITVRPAAVEPCRLSCQAIASGCDVMQKRTCASCTLLSRSASSEIGDRIRLTGHYSEYFVAVQDDVNASLYHLMLNVAEIPAESYAIRLHIDDQFGSELVSAYCKVTVNNGRCPSIENHPEKVNFTLDGTAPDGTIVGFVSPLSMVDSGQYRWQMRKGVDSLSGSFAIVQSTGLLLVRHLRAAGLYRFNVSVESKTCKQKLQVQLEVLVSGGGNFHKPIFRLPPRCSPSNNGQLCHLEASDGDANGNNSLSYSLVNTDAGRWSRLEIGSLDGVLRLTGSHNSNQSTEVRVRVTDGQRPSRSSDLLLRFDSSWQLVSFEPVEWPTIGDQRAPKFLHLPYPEVTVFENATIGLTVFEFQAVDQDVGADGLVTYSIIDGNEDGRWRIDPNTGKLTVQRSLDREQVPRYNLTVAASDGHWPRALVSLSSLLIHIGDSNDQRPVFDRLLYQAEVDENAALGSPILTVRAHDQDLGSNGRVRYKLLTNGDQFALGSHDGLLTVVGQLDRERRRRYDLLVQAVDSGSPPLSSFARILITVRDCNDNAPKCVVDQQRVSVREDIPPHALLTCVEAFDEDDTEVNRRLRFEIQATQKFSIDTETGCLRVADGGLDFHAQVQHRLLVSVRDSGRPSLNTTCTVVVDVDMVNRNRYAPQFDSFAYNADIYENEPPGTVVLSLKAKDPDAVDWLKPSILYSIVGGNGWHYFAIGEQDGVIVSRVPLDRETRPYYWLTVEARDRAPVSLATRVDVFVAVKDRNDNAPVPVRPLYEADVVENCPPGTSIVQLNATDFDEPRSPMLTYSIREGNAQSLFQIDPNTGLIYSGDRRLDREAVSVHQLEVEIRDGGSPVLTSRTLVLIRVLDENDHAPQFGSRLYSFNVPPCTETGQLLCRIFAVDPDAGPNGTVSYSIVHQDGNDGDDGRVQLDPNSGQIYCSRVGSTHWYGQLISLNVEARDSGSPPLSSRTRVVIRFVPPAERLLNAAPVLLSNAHLQLDLVENEPLGRVLVQFEAEDPDSDQVWFYSKQPLPSWLTLVPDTGELVLVDRSNMSNYNFTYAVTDGRLQTVGSVELRSTGVKYYRPILPTLLYRVELPENTTVGSTVLTIEGFFEKPNIQQPITYSLVGNFADKPAKFQLDAVSGALLLAEPLLDRGEQQRRLLMMVEARSYHLKTSAFVQVHVLGSDHQPPRFLKSNYEVSLLVNSVIGTEIIQLVAIDMNEHETEEEEEEEDDDDDDAGDEEEVENEEENEDQLFRSPARALLNYSIVSGNDRRLFHLDSSNGLLTLARSLPVESAEHVLVIKVTKAGQRPSLSDTASVAIRVSLASETYVRFDQKSYHARLRIDATVGSPILLVQADGGGHITYHLDEHPIFTLHPLTGCLSVRRPLINSNSSVVVGKQFKLTISASNLFGHSDTAEVTLTAVAAAAVDTPHNGGDREFEFRPRFSSAKFVGHILENQPAGTVVTLQRRPEGNASSTEVLRLSSLLQVHCDSCSFRLIEPWAKRLFQLDPLTGTLTTLAPLDREQHHDGAELLLFNVLVERIHGSNVLVDSSSWTSTSSSSSLAADTAMVEIVVENVNDCGPVFEPKSQQVRLWLPVAEGVPVVRVRAVDPDGPALSYRLLEDVGLEQQSVLEAFHLDSATGWLTVKNASLILSRMKLNFVVTDGEFEDHAQVELQTLEVVREPADDSIQCIGSRLQAFENGNRSDYIGDVVVVLRNRTEVEVMYSLLNDRTVGHAFTVHPRTGALYTTGVPLDRETRAQWPVVVRASSLRDAANGVLAQCLVLVDVLDQNDNAPVFVGAPYEFRVSIDRTDIGQLIGTVRAVDLDLGPNGQVSYSCLTVDPLFSLNSSTGDLLLQRQLKSADVGRRLKFRIRASDAGQPSLSTVADVFIVISSAETELGLFARSSFRLSILEGEENFFNQALVVVADRPTSSRAGVVGYTMLNQREDDPDQQFALDFVTGELSLQKPLDREQVDQYTIRLQAVDHERNVTEFASVTIVVLDINDNWPQFDQSTYSASLPEDSPIGCSVMQLRATDLDQGDNALLTFRLITVQSLSAEPRQHGEEEKEKSKFKIQSSTGLIQLSDTLDFERCSSYLLEVECRDSGTLSKASTVRVLVSVLDVNDNAPVFTPENTFTIYEDNYSVGQVIGQLSATDLDTVSRGKLRYGLLYAAGQLEQLLFTLNAHEQGILRVGTAMDQQLGRWLPEYRLQAFVNDGLFSSRTEFVVRQIKCSSLSPSVSCLPAFRRRFISVSVSESEPIGSTVTSVAISDSTAHVQYVMLSGLGSSKFMVNPDTGHLIVADQLDYEQRSKHQLVIGARVDNWGIVSTLHVQVDVVDRNDHAPRFVASKYSILVSASETVGTAVLRLFARDRDQLDTARIRYSLVNRGRQPRGDLGASSYFRLDPRSGVLSVRRPLTALSGKNFRLTVKATDGGGHFEDEAFVQVHVWSELLPSTAREPRAESILLHVAEDAPVGTRFGRVRFHAYAGAVARMVPLTDETVAGWIGVEPNGTVYVAQALDRETRTEFSFYVALVDELQTDDHSAWISMTLVNVVVDDVNDNAPIFEANSVQLSVSEDLAPGSILLNLQADDPDTADNGRVHYSLLQQSDAEEQSLQLFHIDSYSGLLTTTGPLDRETHATHRLVILAVDGGRPSLNSTLTVEIRLLDVNDQVPRFDRRFNHWFNLTHADAVAGALIGTVLAVDLDAEPFNKLLRYYIVNVDHADAWSLFKMVNGSLYLSDAFQWKFVFTDTTGTEQRRVFKLTLEVTDGKYSDQTQVWINFEQTDKNRRRCCVSDDHVIELAVEENMPVGTVIYNLTGNCAATTTVDDSGLRGGAKHFVVNSNAIVIAEQTDRELVDRHLFYLRSDENSSLLCQSMFVVNVIDVNDNEPVFKRPVYEISVPEHENVTYPAFVVQVHAVDRDLGPAGRVRYKLQSDWDGLFMIDENSGVLTVNEPLDREQQHEYSIAVLAEDCGHETGAKSLSAQCSVLLTVLDINDNAPEFTELVYKAKVPENARLGDQVIVVKAFSRDVGLNGEIVYELLSNNDGRRSAQWKIPFAIDSQTGTVTVNDSIMACLSSGERQIQLTVVARDRGSPPLSNSSLLVVDLLEVNDHRPQFQRQEYNVEIAENTAIGERIVQVSATDLDRGDNGLVAYRLFRPDESDTFSQLPFSVMDDGWIVVNGSTDREQKARWQFQVEAYDFGKPSRSALATVTVDLVDVNEHPPTVLDCNTTTTVHVKRPLVSGMVLHSLTVDDLDNQLDQQPKFHFQLLVDHDHSNKNNISSLFRIDPDQGILQLVAPTLDDDHYVVRVRNNNDDDDDDDDDDDNFYLNSIFQIIKIFYFSKVKVSDNGEPILSTICQLEIRLAEESKHRPTVEDFHCELWTHVGEFSGGVIGQLRASDQDPLDKLTFSLQQQLTSVVQQQQQGDNTLFNVDPNDGRLLASADLISAGSYMSNVSVFDGKYSSFAKMTVEVHHISREMLNSAVTLQVMIAKDGQRFLQQSLKRLARFLAKLIGVRVKYVHIFSVQPSSVGEEFDDDIGEQNKNNIVIRVRSGQMLDLLVAIQKSKQEFYKPSLISDRLVRKAGEMASVSGMGRVKVVRAACSRVECQNGAKCRDVLLIDDAGPVTLLTDGFSFVSPMHRQTAECLCLAGFGGIYCNQKIDKCASNPCQAGRVCIADHTSTGYHCACPFGNDDLLNCHPSNCRSPTTCTGNLMLSFGGNGFVWFAMDSSFDYYMDVQMEVKTSIRFAVLLFSKGRNDFHQLEIKNGFLQYRFDFGSGQAIVRSSVVLSDDHWHVVRLLKRDRQVSLTVDEKQNRLQLSGSSSVLNFFNRGSHLYVGAEVIDTGNRSSLKNAFLGCIRGLVINGEAKQVSNNAGVELFGNVQLGTCSNGEDDDEHDDDDDDDDDDESYRQYPPSPLSPHLNRQQVEEGKVHGACSIQPCLNGGSCVGRGSFGFTCLCPARYFGTYCEIDRTPCLSSPCQNGATCINLFNDFQCRCAKLFIGRTCSERKPTTSGDVEEDACASSPCANGGQCLLNDQHISLSNNNNNADDEESKFTCNCTAGWTGRTCSLPSDSLLHTGPNVIAGVSLMEFVGIVILLLLLALVALTVVLLCRRRRRRLHYRKVRVKRTRHEEILLDQRQPLHPRRRSAARATATTAVAAAAGAGSSVHGKDEPPSLPLPPPIPPRFPRSFQPHRGSKLSNFESALSTGIPTVQVRPLSFMERPSGDSPSAVRLLIHEQAAASYGSAAEELELFGDQATNKAMDANKGAANFGNTVDDDWKTALDNIDSDSLDKLKRLAGITADESDETDENDVVNVNSNTAASTAAQTAKVQRNKSNTSGNSFHWDYSDWTNTIGNTGYPSLGHITDMNTDDDDDEATNTLPRGICRLEDDTDYEYALNSGSDDNNETERVGIGLGNEIREQIRAIGLLNDEINKVDQLKKEPPQSCIRRYLPMFTPPSSGSERRRLLDSPQPRSTSTMLNNAQHYYSDVPSLSRDSECESVESIPLVRLNSSANKSNSSRSYFKGNKNVDKRLPTSVNRSQSDVSQVCELEDDEEEHVAMAKVEQQQEEDKEASDSPPLSSQGSMKKCDSTTTTN
ncbi:Protocadherin Fat 1 [Trichinella pseudospiralis]|uniref:Protocadherin Fat 1 n=2 Tax=Trichinella pseudospiralis TaxID=6337 RepID=A0A0V1EM10_TRIPS|nr:Protocadherin Fat 1 [Trichinella pseudospiralis]